MPPVELKISTDELSHSMDNMRMWLDDNKVNARQASGMPRGRWYGCCRADLRRRRRGERLCQRLKRQTALIFLTISRTHQNSAACLLAPMDRLRHQRPGIGVSARPRARSRRRHGPSLRSNPITAGDVCKPSGNCLAYPCPLLYPTLAAVIETVTSTRSSAG
jgi:hypothetical protein